jgi:putative sterol carrier protein/NAD(P)H-dependent FMN reductase
MKIVSIYGAVPDYNNGILNINELIKSILIELDIEILEVNLFNLQIPYFNDTIPAHVSQIAEKIKEYDAVIFIGSCNSFAPCAVMQNFLEYFSSSKFDNILHEKNCLIAISSNINGEKDCIDYMSKIINKAGGYDSVKIALNSDIAKKIELDPNFKDIIEKQVEDFYRFIKQNRKYIIPTQVITQPGQPIGTLIKKPTELNQHVESSPFNHINSPKVTAQEINQKYNIDNFNDAQRKDVTEISEVFSQKYEEIELGGRPNFFNEQLQIPAPDAPLEPKAKTCKQLTSSLPHRFQSQLSNGLNAVIQFMVTGEENFNATLTISNTECFYEEGVIVNPDITIVTDSSVLNNVLKGVQTAQKAFMVGQLKVRGNFVILTKFDQLFTSSV